MTEDNFEEFLKKAAQGYNVPPARTPREDMWSAIQAQRAAGPRVVYGGGSPMRESSGRRFGSKIWLGAAAAAVLFLATGVGIGRWSASSKTPASVAAVTPPGTGSSAASSESASAGSVAGSADEVASNQPAGGSETSSSGRVRVGTESRPIDANGGNGTRVALGATSDQFRRQLRIPAHGGPAPQRSRSASHFVQDALDNGSANGRAARVLGARSLEQHPSVTGFSRRQRSTASSAAGRSRARARTDRPAVARKHAAGSRADREDATARPCNDEAAHRDSRGIAARQLRPLQ